MQGNSKVITKLNDLLSDELTAVNQYMVHAEMAANWGYVKYHEYAEKRAIEEMKHAAMLIARVLFLEGTPVVSEYKKINIGALIPDQLTNDHKAEEGAIASYNDGINIAVEMKDNATRELLETILKDEDRHIDDIEANQQQVKDLGIENYLANQVG